MKMKKNRWVRGVRGDPGWNPPAEKQKILQMGKVQGRVHPKLKHILSECQHALRVPAARGRISVACGNSSARGPREERVRTKKGSKIHSQL